VSVTQPLKAAPLAAPEKVTVRWLVDNVGLGGWAAFIGLIVALLSAAYAAGRYDTLRKLIPDITSLLSSSPPPH
jgi:hypothetical protein